VACYRENITSLLVDTAFEHELCVSLFCKTSVRGLLVPEHMHGVAKMESSSLRTMALIVVRFEAKLDCVDKI
jgi:hypothetical protein